MSTWLKRDRKTRFRLLLSRTDAVLARLLVNIAAKASLARDYKQTIFLLKS